MTEAATADPPSTPRRVAVLGAGSWGTAFAMILADAGADVALWARRDEVAEAVNTKHENPGYLPGCLLPEAVVATTDPSAALEGAEVVVLALPSQTLRGNLLDVLPHIGPRAVLVSLAKGIELGTDKRMSEVITDVTGAGPDRVAVVTGPNLAREISQRQIATAVVACRDETVARALQSACHTPYFRPYTNTDVVGCELGGAVKNVIALAVGIAEGLGLGDNAKASLITRGLAETLRLGVTLGADPLTFSGLAGLGDLVATCFSPLSRNHRFGLSLGQGMSREQAAAVVGQTVEGVKSCESVLDLARRHAVDMPITETVVGVVHDGRSPHEMLRGLMARAAKPERPVQ